MHSADIYSHVCGGQHDAGLLQQLRTGAASILEASTDPACVTATCTSMQQAYLSVLACWGSLFCGACDASCRDQTKPVGAAHCLLSAGASTSEVSEDGVQDWCWHPWFVMCQGTRVQSCWALHAFVKVLLHHQAMLLMVLESLPGQQRRCPQQRGLQL